MGGNRTFREGWGPEERVTTILGRLDGAGAATGRAKAAERESSMLWFREARWGAVSTVEGLLRR